MTTLNSADQLRFQEVESIGAGRQVVVSRGNGFALSATSGTIGATLGANSSIFAMRLSPTSTVNAFIERIRIEVVTIVAFTTPVTAGRRLALFRGSGAAASGGTTLSGAGSILPKRGTADTSQFTTANSGDARIATTGALTITGITYETVALAEFGLVHVGNAGNFREVIYDFGGGQAQPIQLTAGQLIAVRNPAAMDAAGTFQITVSVDWHEAPALVWS